MLKKQAEEEWKARENLETWKGKDKTLFCRVYRQVYAPRAHFYRAIFLFVIALFSPLVFQGLKTFWAFFSSRTLQHQETTHSLKDPAWLKLVDTQNWIYEGSLASQFFVYFGLIVFWSLMASWFAKQYHFKAPSKLLTELKKQNFFTQTPPEL